MRSTQRESAAATRRRSNDLPQQRCVPAVHCRSAIGMEARVAQDTEQDIRERNIFRMVAGGLMLAGWSIGIVNLMGWARF
jgi:hypothetical protein